MVDQFAIEYQKFHGISDARARRQLKELRTFAAFAGKDSPELCDAQDFRRYLSHLVDRGLHVNTVRKRGNFIRPFYTWCFQAEVITGDKLMAVRNVANPNGSTNQGEPKPYSRKELRAFWNELASAWPKVDAKWWKRWRSGQSRYKRIATHAMRLQVDAIVALALDCGLRLAEIYNVSIEDIHPDNEYVVVRQRHERANGKDHRREVPYTDDARAAVNAWLELRTELDPPHERVWLSLTHFGPEGVWLQPLSEKRMRSLLLTIGDWQLHRFRHTCATNWLRSGMDLEVVSRFLGHSNIKQTLRYAAIIRDDIQRQVTRSEASFRQMTGRHDEQTDS